MNEVQDENVIGETLTLKQEAFCRYYTQNDALFGNATLSYAEAYGFDLDNDRKDDAKYKCTDGAIAHEYEFELMDKGEDKFRSAKKIEDSTHDRNYDYCSKAGSRLMRNGKIDARVIELLNEIMTNDVVDAEIAKVMKQSRDLPSKMRAIGEYNKLKQRIIDKKDITSGGKVIGGFEFIRNDGEGNNKTEDTPHS